MKYTPTSLLLIICFLFSCRPENNIGSSSKIEQELMNYGWKSDIQYDHLIYGTGADMEFSWDRESSTYFFIGNGDGFCRTYRHSEDTYFGTKNQTLTSDFSYHIKDDFVFIGNLKYKLEGDYLVQQDCSEPSILKKTTITSEDRKFIELAPYSLLTGTNRVSFPIDIKCEPLGSGAQKVGNVYFYYIDVNISLSEKDHVYTRGITDIEFTFTVENGTGSIYGNKPVEKHVFINGDKNITQELVMFAVAGDNPVINVRVRCWDPDSRSYLDNFGEVQKKFQITKPDYVKDLENADNNGDNNGGNNGNNYENNGDNNGNKNEEYLGGLNSGSTVTNTPGPQPLNYKINGVQYKMILVQGGSIKPFYIMQTELPPSAKIEINGYTFGPCDANGDNIITTNEYQKFIQDVRKRTGWNLRMPTISEWKFAAKGGASSKGYTYCGGNSINDVAWYSGNARKAQGIAQKTPNELSLYDMSGNYGELTYYTNADTGTESVDGDIYGGCWESSSSSCYPTSWVENLKTTGFVNKYTRIRHLNACDASKETFRLVYQKP